MSSREIKFRCWNKDTKKMVNLNAITPLALSPFLDEKGVFVPFNQGPVMQYTGLLDKNGKEIYEGDIVKCFYPQEIKIMQVIFNQDTVSFEFKGEEVYDSLVNAGNFEVIGNIYEDKAQDGGS